ncbi:NAD(P)/FAD-dependent oxidoreductase [Cohnella lubricantis]|uniref:NAD(P)/FAD-dependent oxidoreductase n=1 Tax=Cohnella lubricantis TaxID=2163172 RepID=A0A841TAM6_9BACL|nr:NAD(P)/FAD-dependent oxidoreductase [Cohnella lubricantis]MBB6676448.1 NAD(P)/FAD-dependent oxidoreductase [Cohnella lubricantis]MBP2117545.1 thioredoxin reductase [Cohnella lubricantis]
MLFDCAIIGGGPAGLSAALVLGRARRKTALFDNNKPRNAVTRETHGFLTRDGASPEQLRQAAHEDIAKYASVQFYRDAVTEIRKEPNAFAVHSSEGEVVRSRKIILATGLREYLPSIPGLRECYGSSLFSCPYCDGWEQRDRPLVVIAEKEDSAYHLAKTAHQWSKDLLLCTNGVHLRERWQREMKANAIVWRKAPVQALEHRDGMLERVVFEDGDSVPRSGGFVATDWVQSSMLGESLGCKLNERGGIETDDYGRTSVEGVFAAGDAAVIAPAQLIVAAAEGSRAAMGVNGDLIHESFAGG